ncbi:hypothetical protein GCM10022224_086980 [Nonomuraea antimicrobica]|uniref:Uncharacterized protein n=1 Tax=Nonomuraea antimicrobica TaxID=561173 RepID=A0ABP7DNI0_9ACTN
MTDGKPPGRLRPARPDPAAGSGTGRDPVGGTPITSASQEAPHGQGARREAGAGREGRAQRAGREGRAEGAGRRAGAATGVGTAGSRPHGVHPRLNPAADLGIFGGPGQHGDPGDGMLHAQRTWDATLATNRLDVQGVNIERLRLETKDVTASVSLLVDGWPDDLRRCLRSVIEHTAARVLALDLGNVDGAGDVLRELAGRHPDRIVEWHVTERPHWRGGTATWGESRTKLLQLDEAEVHVLMETNVVLGADALTPLIAAVVEGAVAAGWKGVEPADGGDRPEWERAGPGRVRALTGELIAVRRAQALSALPADAHYGRYADLELSLALPGELVVPSELLPVTLLGRHEIAPDYLDRESRRNYDGVLRMLRAS